jgi:hypothetical protein
MRFLTTVFGVGDGHRMFQADVLRWKCFAPHPFWEGSRGYALRYKGAIAAFGCVVPCGFLTGAGIVASCNVIDWAADKTVPGAGAMLYRHIQGLAGTMINIGGTADARRVLPQIGFQARADRQVFTRVLRPWRHFRQTEQRDWKSPLRLARDIRELGRAQVAAAGILTAHRLDSFVNMPAEVFPGPSITGQAVCARTAALFDYFMACPAAEVTAHLLERDRTPAGYFLLSRVGAQCRIADLWIGSPDQRVWAAAYSAATSAARTDRKISEVVVAVSAPLAASALVQAGYRRTHQEPVYVFDPERRLGDQLAVGFLENDGYYWHGS